MIQADSAAQLPDAQISLLQRYSACDISDALLALHVPAAGFLANLIPYSSPAPEQANIITIAPVSTVLFASSAHPEEHLTPTNIPPRTHWVDLTREGTFVIIKQPPGQFVAVCGGILALRMKTRGVKGIVVAGRVRDVQELRETGLPVLAYGTSTVGSAGTNIPWAIEQPIEINGVVINPGDIAFHDPVNGVVIIPRDKVDEVLALLPGIVAADDRVKEDVRKDMSVYEAFKLHRGK